MSDATINRTRKRKKRRRRIRKGILWFVLIAFAAGVIYLGVLPRLRAAATTTYDSYETTRGSITNAMSFSGSIDVVNEETLAADGAATVRKVYVQEGEAVSANQRLIRLSNGDILKAGFDGEVNSIAVEEGDDVIANDSLIEIVDFSNLEVSIRVDEYSMASVSAGQACEVTVTALEQTFDSEISHINRIPTGGGSTAYYTVTAQFMGSQDVLPGMQVTVVIPEEEAENVVILRSDALSFGQANNAYVLVQNDTGEMEPLYVGIGVSNDRFVEITSGLDEGVTVYKEVDSVEQSTGLASLFSSLPDNNASSSSSYGPPGGGEFGGGDFSNRNFGGGMP